jgi:hypothetical protein
VQSRGRCGMTPLHEAAGSGKSNVSSSSYHLLAFALLNLNQLVNHRRASDTSGNNSHTQIVWCVVWLQ